MRDLHFRAPAFCLVFLLSFPHYLSSGNRPAPDQSKHIVAVVDRCKGRLTIKIEPDPVPGSDPLTIFDALRKEFSSEYPVVAIVKDTAKITDLYEVSGMAGKAGFSNVRTFILSHNNHAIFEIKFGPSMPFSTKGPFDTAATPSH